MRCHVTAKEEKKFLPKNNICPMAGTEWRKKLKIAFWSNLRGQCGVTTNLACMAAMSAISGIGKCILLENHYNLNSLGNILLPPERVAILKEKGQYYNKYGIEYLLKRLYTGESGEALIHKASVPLLYSSILYLPQSYIVNREVFNYEFELVRSELFRCLEEVSELVYIDTEANRNISSNAILQEADLIVVNLYQDQFVWREFFDNYPSIRDKCIFLIGKYQPDWKYNLIRIRREFQIPRNRIGAIPYNMELQSAMNEGRTLQFLNRNYLKTSQPDNEILMKELKPSAGMLRENVLEIRREKRRMLNSSVQQNYNR